MKQYIYAASSLLWLLPFVAFGAASSTESVTLTLPSDGTSYTLSSGSVFDSLDISAGTFKFSMSGGQSFILTSSDRKNLTNNIGATVTCDASQSSISVSLPAVDNPRTIDVTPSGNCSTSSTTQGGGIISSGGGGGSGSNSSTPYSSYSLSASAGTSNVSTAVSTASKIADLQAKIDQLKQQLAAMLKTGGSSVGTGISAGGLMITKGLSLGSRNDEVKVLQQFLAKYPDLYPAGLVTGYYGAMTTKAVKLFQEKYGIAKPGVSGYGNVGPKTRAKINELNAVK